LIVDLKSIYRNNDVALDWLPPQPVRGFLYDLVKAVGSTTLSIAFSVKEKMENMKGLR
jgi:hypothetical protein